eukprot:SAG11_NODE_2092_length_3841_cov_2.213789_5_plen_78_part_00
MGRQMPRRGRGCCNDNVIVLQCPEIPPSGLKHLGLLYILRNDIVKECDAFLEIHHLLLAAPQRLGEIFFSSYSLDVR